MKAYELTYIISPEITSEEAEAKAKEFESLITSKEGVVLKQSTPLARTLSYPIKKHASGFFGVIEFNIEPEKLPEIEAVLQKDGKISRHMVIIKQATQLKKERRTRTKPATFAKVEEKTEVEPVAKEKIVTKSSEKEKVELKDIEQKLDEILGE